MRSDLKFALIAALTGGGLVLPALAGPEPIRPDYSKDSKDKNIVEQVAEPAVKLVRQYRRRDRYRLRDDALQQ